MNKSEIILQDNIITTIILVLVKLSQTQCIT